MKIQGIFRDFLLDTGCDMSLFPLRFVRGLFIRPTKRRVYAANGAEIKLAGEVTVKLQLGNLTISTEVLVSKHVSEGMLGCEWLSQNDGYWSFRSGQVMIRNQIFSLITRTGEHRCCRILTQEDVVIPRQSETVIPAKVLFDRVNTMQEEELAIEFATVPSEIRSGLFVARTLMPHRCENVPLRVLNSSNKMIRLKRGSTVAELEPVELVEAEDPEEEDSSLKTRAVQEEEEWKQELMSRVEPDVPAEMRAEILKILNEYSDCFSKSEFDFG